MVEFGIARSRLFLRSKGQKVNIGPGLTTLVGFLPQFSSNWLEIWRGFIFPVTEFSQPIILGVNIDQKVNIDPRSTTKEVFLKSSIFISLIWNLKRIFRSGHWIQPPNIFEVNLCQKDIIGRISKIVNFHPIELEFEEELYIWSFNSTTNYFRGQISFMDFVSIVLCTTSSNCYFQNRRLFKYIGESIFLFCLAVCLSVCLFLLPTGHKLKPMFTKLHQLIEVVSTEKAFDFEI